MKERLYSVKELAEILNVSPGHVRNLVKRGEATCYRLGHRILFSEGHLNDLLRRHENGAAQKVA